MQKILKQVENKKIFDVLIIGSGAAGNSLALQLPKTMSVGLISKTELHEGSTYYAQGGISAVLSKIDSINQHVEDTMEAGAGLCKEDIVKAVAKDSKVIIEWLLEQGVKFTKNESGSSDKLHLTKEGGHTYPRIVHAADKTGEAIQDSLINKVKKQSNIELFTHHVAIDLITKENKDSAQKRCVGSYILNKKNNQINVFKAKFVVLATGGANKVYLYTSNPDTSSGDGIAMAYRAGCDIANMEFMQFHPTCLFHHKAKSFLISESLRGEGGRLLLPNGDSFMHKYDSRGVLAPRDIVARAIDSEMKINGFDYVLLDISHKKSSFIKKRFPNIYKKCLEFNIDITKTPMPVVPATHYTCGGINIDINARTNIKNLYAIGEVAHSGLHGANRMASNSLLECIFFSKKVLEDIKKYENEKHEDIRNLLENNKDKKVSEEVIIKHSWKEIRTLMWNYVGIVRTNERLLKAKIRISIFKREVEESFDKNIISSDLIELRNLIYIAEIIITSALARKESRGLHYNLDYPKINDEAKDTIINIGVKNNIKLYQEK
ncbi:L-aspartate oxidase [Gammaproteobacteria bacterium]|nr:L-aspartate oxidase [Gammaproteobacteria bacterium]